MICRLIYRQRLISLELLGQMNGFVLQQATDNLSRSEIHNDIGNVVKSGKEVK